MMCSFIKKVYSLSKYYAINSHYGLFKSLLQTVFALLPIKTVYTQDNEKLTQN